MHSRTCLQYTYSRSYLNILTKNLKVDPQKRYTMYNTARFKRPMPTYSGQAPRKQLTLDTYNLLLNGDIRSPGSEVMLNVTE